MNTLNKKRQWGVVLGQPTSSHPNPSDYQNVIGQWVNVNGNSIGLFNPSPADMVYSKSEAEALAAKYRKLNHLWNYHPKKYNPNDRPSK